jgi:hypothetical protein
MATTTNYGWTTPNDTDLVKDGAAAIRTLGSSVDTTTKALNPSTTLGDIEYRSATANTNTRLGVGTTGQVLTVASGVPSWATPAAGGGGKVLQVVQGFIDAVASVATTTWTDTGITATITPSAASSKVLILVSLAGVGRTSGGTVDKTLNIRLQKDATTLKDLNVYMLYNDTTNAIYGASMASNFLDSPSSTSALTYKVQFQVESGASLARISFGSVVSSITLLEIGA